MGIREGISDFAKDAKVKLEGRSALSTNRIANNREALGTGSFTEACIGRICNIGAEAAAHFIIPEAKPEVIDPGAIYYD